ncbi:MAG TPA: FAD-linked oxidase C-terminal domain-containing protein, partial [Roseiflexaceae bacterium]|nr:FAD-linked oxidase C-terminal domain-containing protein [Roseiflexaceae bacterium]
LSEAEGQAVWRELAAFVALEAGSRGPALGGGRDEPAELLIRAGTRPSALGLALAALEQHAPGGAEVVGYAGVGLAHVRWPLPEGLDAAALVPKLAALRAALAAEDGYAVVEDAPDLLRSALDLWGAPPPTLTLMRALKAQWDPHGILNPGRYISGLYEDRG